MDNPEANPPGAGGERRFRHPKGPETPAVRSNVSLYQRRIEFLVQIAECYPRVLLSLREQPLGELDAWAGRWHLDDEWILQAAEETRRVWERYPEDRPHALQWYVPNGLTHLLIPEPPPLVIPAYLPDLESRKDFRARLNALAGEHIEGVERGKQQLRDGGNRWAHARWLAHRVVERMTYDRICRDHADWYRELEAAIDEAEKIEAEKNDKEKKAAQKKLRWLCPRLPQNRTVSPSTVQAACNRLAKEIGVTLSRER